MKKRYKKEEPETTETTYQGRVVIQGNSEFTKLTIEALDLIKQKSPEDFEMVLRNIGRIEAKPGLVGRVNAEISAHQRKPTVYVNPSASKINAGPTFYGGTLIHEAQHAKDARTYAKKHPFKSALIRVFTLGARDSPESAFSGPEAELRCRKAESSFFLKPKKAHKEDNKRKGKVNA